MQDGHLEAIDRWCQLFAHRHPDTAGSFDARNHPALKYVPSRLEVLLRGLKTDAVDYLTDVLRDANICIRSHVVYLRAVQFTWFKDLNVPEVFGFLHNQVTPFETSSPDSSNNLYVWHILPVELYRKNEPLLLSEPSGFATDITSRSAFSFLQTDPEARLVIHFHGAGGTVASLQRCPNYRALSAGDPDRIHVLTFDYGGYGRSKGRPSEQSLILDAISVVEWAIHVARVPPSRIVMYGQSLGTAVNMAVAEHYAVQSPPVVLAGHILTAPFVDVPTLVSTYKVAKTIPILGPLARFPVVFDYLRTLLRDQWPTKDRSAAYVRANEAHGNRYRITLLHAEDDGDISWMRSSELHWYAVNASMPLGITYDALDQLKSASKVDLGYAGSVVPWKTDNGVIREEILKYGLYDVMMDNPVVSLAVMRILKSASI